MDAHSCGPQWCLGADEYSTIKEGSPRHPADILRGGGGPGRVSCPSGATPGQRLNSTTPLKLMQIGESHGFVFMVIGTFLKIFLLAGYSFPLLTR
ncbi:hypothetical protein PUN28_005727 [Cardiocondyla obscurior]|uniref:Uncharacterized protein n=1 Tax=Cardiocondyla obscurior TaxID=286306 RepID=A0AAW2G5D6_9HYME